MITVKLALAVGVAWECSGHRDMRKSLVVGTGAMVLDYLCLLAEVVLVLQYDV